MIPHLFFYQLTVLDSCGCVSCCTLPGPADARRHRERQPSPSCRGGNAPRSLSRLQASPISPTAPCVSTRRRIPSCPLRCHLSRCPRRTAAPHGGYFKTLLSLCRLSLSRLAGAGEPPC